ncbi:hypothetical protein [Streptomyces natalensis]|uniref:hypothetical protein n=1 Tax=Streptomyces natalensis TaxID=68242 RepID=UPI00068F8D36|nr:hypothetical protein [Streptomyces natalensis]
MGFNPNNFVTIKLDCVGWHQPYTRDITRHQLGELLLQLDTMAADTDDEEASGWPTPDEAYVGAPSIADEFTWLYRTAADWHDELDREWYLRQAAFLDRIALRNDPEEPGIAAEEAQATATFLLDCDKAGDGDYGGQPYWPEHPAAEANPRGYVRQEYVLWHRGRNTDTQ